MIQKVVVLKDIGSLKFGDRVELLTVYSIEPEDFSAPMFGVLFHPKTHETFTVPVDYYGPDVTDSRFHNAMRLISDIPFTEENRARIVMTLVSLG